MTQRQHVFDDLHIMQSRQEFVEKKATNFKIFCVYTYNLTKTVMADEKQLTRRRDGRQDLTPCAATAD